ncbi:MAG TPA: 16S rRNA (cytosine(1402)-N(4))-methyltransferase RsmH [Pirellulales bacterium]|jgi:16S rRNA (cytosine1402-N4)-methyltransferase|nr:16S rRNA (cytosine(1402)-N(4))-methyltransferase RsmH [Pirellulales bacterium]
MEHLESAHVPVMTAEVLQWLAPQPGGTIVDGTLGGGGHTLALAERVGSTGLVLALDRDPGALEKAERRLAGRSIKLAAANYQDLGEVLAEIDVSSVDGIVLDLGLSSDQLVDRTRGFSFDSDGPLDMRFDTTSGEPAWRLLDRLTEKELADVIYQFGEERFSRRIARNIVAARTSQPVRTAAQLSALVERSVPRTRSDAGRIHPATRTFQAIRIAVNDELRSLSTALDRFPEYLREGGRLAVISFHSLEDRIVKGAFRDSPRYRALTKKPVRPSEQEIQRNPRARSAKLRVAERV